MLILSRHLGESISIGTEITIKVLSVNNGQTTLGIKAPRAVEVYREEIFARIQAEKKTNLGSQS